MNIRIYKTTHTCREIGGTGMKKTGILITCIMALFLVGAFFTAGNSTSVSAASTKTGTGLAEHALKAYNEGWKYSYGAYGQLSGGTRITDCAGLIKSYLWWTGDTTNPKVGAIAVGGGASAMLNSCTESGTINYSDSSSLPRVHGLILYQPGHIGIYVGNNMAVDNRDYGMDVKYEQVFGRAKPKWTQWGKLPQVTYPTTGFVTFNGNEYYYENGQYVVSTTRTFDDQVYTFGDDGTVVSVALTPEAQAAKAAAEAAALEAARLEEEKNRLPISGLSGQTAVESSKSEAETETASSSAMVFTQDTVKISKAAPKQETLNVISSDSQTDSSLTAFFWVLVSVAIISVLTLKLGKRKSSPYNPAADMVWNFKNYK